MVWTLVSKRPDGFWNQKIKVNTDDLELLEQIAVALALVENTNNIVEIYDGLVPKGDLWGHPKYVVRKNKNTNHYEKLEEFKGWN